MVRVFAFWHKNVKDRLTARQTGLGDLTTSKAGTEHLLENTSEIPSSAYLPKVESKGATHSGRSLFTVQLFFTFPKFFQCHVKFPGLPATVIADAFTIFVINFRIVSKSNI